jgi:hypothetical protein
VLFRVPVLLGAVWCCPVLFQCCLVLFQWCLVLFGDV